MLKTTAAVYGLTSFIFLLLVILYSIAAATASNNDHTKSFWTNGSPIPTPRTEVSATAVGGSVYVIGGFNAQGQPTNIVEVYNTKNNTWSSAAPLPHPLHHTAAATSFDSKIYVIGGYLDSQWNPSNRLFIYDPPKNQWHEGKRMPTARGALTANFVGGILYAVGGQSFLSSSSSPSGILTTNEAYDPPSNTWKTKAPMLSARHHAASSVVSGKLYVIGGRVAGISPTVNVDVNEVYDPEKIHGLLFHLCLLKEAELQQPILILYISMSSVEKNHPRHLTIMKGTILKLTNGSLKHLCLLHVMD